jgi:hypothetical protein
VKTHWSRAPVITVFGFGRIRFGSGFLAGSSVGFTVEGVDCWAFVALTMHSCELRFITGDIHF